MITRDQIRDWLEIDKREKVLIEIEKYIDNQLKAKLMKGETTIIISTMKYIDTFQTHEDTEFMGLWNNPELSEDNKEYVREQIVEKYRKHGFDVEVKQSNIAHTSDMKYDFLKFKDIHKMIENNQGKSK